MFASISCIVHLFNWIKLSNRQFWKILSQMSKAFSFETCSFAFVSASLCYACFFFFFFRWSLWNPYWATIPQTTIVKSLSTRRDCCLWSLFWASPTCPSISPPLQPAKLWLVSASQYWWAGKQIVMHFLQMYLLGLRNQIFFLSSLPLDSLTWAQSPPGRPVPTGQYSNISGATSSSNRDARWVGAPQRAGQRRPCYRRHTVSACDTPPARPNCSPRLHPNVCPHMPSRTGAFWLDIFWGERWISGMLDLSASVFVLSQSEIRAISVNQWGSQLGLSVLNKLSQLYCSLVWESTVLLSLCTPNRLVPHS